ncbi:hypothetical protein CCACVL1_30600 [Corchorus capsularis]|uniref:Uncharacterized protein n=1 Tax=Corchorus capsularis TaxID=210143 RepID=A0A1R3FWD9_COCAP|nr:hypothetical protein CCACVL1_30600 [Corchorus capsularis]
MRRSKRQCSSSIRVPVKLRHGGAWRSDERKAKPGKLNGG